VKLQAVRFVSFYVRDTGKSAFEFLTAAVRGSLLQVSNRLPSRYLFGNRRGHQLIEGDLLLLSHLARLPCQGVRDFHVHSRHGISPSLCRNCLAVTTSIPKLSAAAKSRKL